MLCPDCGAESAFATRCTDCGAPLPGPVDPRPPTSDGWQLWRIKPLVRLAVVLYVLLGATVIAFAVSAAAYLHRAERVDDFFHGDPKARSFGDLKAIAAADDFVVVSTTVSTVALAVTGAVFIAWFHRARRNVMWMGPDRPRLGPGWSVGGWFCPVVNLWFPARIAHDIWTGSDGSRGARQTSGPVGRTVLITCWWVPFVLAVSVDRLVAGFGAVADRFHILPFDDGIDGFLLWSRIAAASGLLMVVAGAFAIPLVHRVTALQTERTRQLWATHGSPPRWRTTAAASIAPLPRSPWAGAPRD
ncbi:DUF4328 domain-containing protein [Streptodolium elevatio]